MTRKMTVVFHDEELYTDLKVAAVRQRKTASDIVAEAVKEWLESREDAGLTPMIKAREAEHREQGGKPWSDVEKEWDRSISRREKTPVVAEKTRIYVQD